MKTTILAGLTCILAVFSSPTSCLASAVGTTLVQQPINLGGRADPSRIPLGDTPVICNYNYGMLSVIDAPRPCSMAPLTWESGSEFNQNLASVFGITIEEGDLGINPKEPVILHLKPWKAPAYSPYSKEQVVAATLWCVLHAAGGTPENPLDIRIAAEAPEDKPLESKFSKKYVTMPGEDGKPVPPLEIPGTRVETDARGIQWVIFTGVKAAAHPADFPQPSMLPVRNWATETEENSEVDFIPVWGNGGKAENPLALVFSSANICYRVFNSHGRQEANELILAGHPGIIDASSDETGHVVSLGHPEITQETLASGLRALVLTALPTAERPLRFRIVMEESRRAHYPAFINLPGWTETKSKPADGYFNLECTFVWDPEKRTLLKGSFPPNSPASSGQTTGNYAENRRQLDELREKVTARVRAAIQAGIADGSLQPPVDLSANTSGITSFANSLAIAGYHSGLASCSNPVDEWEIPLSAPLQLEDDKLSKAYRKGWDEGRVRGLAIIQQARKELSAEKTNQ